MANKVSSFFILSNNWYNNTRIHGSLDYKTPNQKYKEYIEGVA